MIIGIGTDIVEIVRLQRILERQGEAFAKRVLHDHEYATFCKLPTNKTAAWLAKRFATKEAVAKAFGTGIGQHVRLQDIETQHDALGKPVLQLHGVTAETALQKGVSELQVSVADEQTYAVAFVVITGGANASVQ